MSFMNTTNLHFTMSKHILYNIPGIPGSFKLTESDYHNVLIRVYRLYPNSTTSWKRGAISKIKIRKYNVYHVVDLLGSQPYKSDTVPAVQFQVY